MTASSLEEALDRVERALLRIERSVQRGTMHVDTDKDLELRSKIAGALAELDDIIREAGR